VAALVGGVNAATGLPQSRLYCPIAAGLHGAGAPNGAELAEPALEGEVANEMAYVVSGSGHSGRGVRVLSALAAALAAGAIAAAAPAMAQKKEQPKAAPAAQPAAKDAGKAAGSPKDAAAAGKQSAWVKICEKAAFARKDKDGKDTKEEKNICLTHHERLDGNTGMVLVSAAIREVDGSDKEHLMVMVPLGMAIPPGVRAAVYSKEQWAKAAKNEKIDEKALKPIELKYSLCHQAGCTAEAEATKEVVDQMKAGGGLMILAMNAAAQPIGFPVPLDGFPEALAGKPVDNKEYAKARGQLMAQIRQRQAELVEQYKKEQEAKQAAGAAAGAPPAAAPAAPAAAAPAAKGAEKKK
jgi:invasion protein IalB